MDVRALTLPVTDFSLQSLADRHSLRRREVLPDLVFGVLAGCDAADVHHAGRNGFSTEHILESPQPAFAENEDVLLRDADRLQKPFSRDACRKDLYLPEILAVPFPHMDGVAPHLDDGQAVGAHCRAPFGP